MSTPVTKQRINIHILNARNKGNVGTLAAQRALYRLLMDNNTVDLSISVTNKEVFKQYHPDFKDNEIYEPLLPNLRSKIEPSHLEWIIFTFFKLTLFTFSAIFIQIGIKLPFKTEIINRMETCDVFIDLNLEFFKGIPICVSPALMKQKSRIVVIHKLFWSLRMLSSLWYLFLVKVIFKKKLVVGPASFGPFNTLPSLTQKLVKFILNRFVDVILVREPYSAKILDELGIKNYLITSDAALVVKTKHSSSTCDFFPTSKPLIGVAPGMFTFTLTQEETDNYIMSHVKCLDDIIREYDASIVFLPSSPDDIAICKMMKALMKDKNHTKIVITDDVDEYESWIRKLNLLITTRMHPSIIAARNRIPFSAIIYDHKQIGLFQQLGLKGISLPIGNISYSELKLIINHVIQNWSKIKEILESSLPKLQDETIMKLRYALKTIKT